MRSKMIVSFSVGIVLMTTTAFAQVTVRPEVESAAQAAAARALREPVSQTGPRLAGMPAPDGIDTAALGDPIAVSMVRLDELQRFQAASDPEALLHDLRTVIYPIRVAGRIQGEMVVRQVAGAWRARGFAGPARLQALESVRGRVTSVARIAIGATMLIRVPALNIELVGYRDATGLKLAPTADLVSVGLTAGQALPASRVFELLSSLARAHNGLPS